MIHIYKLLPILLLLSACSSKPIDSFTKNAVFPLKVNELLVFNDYNEFVYEHSVRGRRGQEIITPKHFKVGLPKNILSYEIYNSSVFGFFYPGNEMIFIQIDLEHQTQPINSVYYPDANQLDRILENMPFRNKKFKERSFNKSRKSVSISKGPAEIILYNILPENLDKYLKLVDTFEFLH